MVIDKRILIFERSIFGKFLWWELSLMFLVGSYFVFITPWDDPYSSYRLPTQRLPLRTLVGLIRFTEITLSFYCFFYLFRNKLIDIDFYIKTIFWFVLITITVGLFDFLVTKGAIREFLMPSHYALSRFTGLVFEPRGVGQLLALSMFSFIALGHNINKYKTMSIIGSILCLLGIAFSFSSTAIIYPALTLLFFFLLGYANWKFIVGTLVFYVIALFILLNNQQFVDHQTRRLTEVGLEMEIAKIHGVPDFVNRFEVFDRTALAFLYFNPQYAILGVGPNTINIPSGKYLSPLDIEVYKGHIDTSPVNFFLTIISRSGLVGLSFILIGIARVYIKTKAFTNNNLTKLLFLFTIYSFMYYNLLYLMILGIICGIILAYEDQNDFKYKNLRQI